MSNINEFIRPPVIRTTLQESDESYIRIDLNSRDRLNKDQTSDICDFFLDKPIEKSPFEKLVVSILNVSIPYSWNTVEDGINNEFFISKDGNPEISILIPEGNYTANSLIKALNSGLTGPHGIVITQVEGQFKYNWKRNVGTNWTLRTDNSLYLILGLEQNQTYNTLAGVNFLPPNLMMMNRIFNIVISTNLTGENTITSSKNLLLLNTLANIPVNASAYSVITYSDVLSRFGIVLNKGIHHIHFQLLDQDGAKVDLNGLNWSISLLIKRKQIVYNI